MWSNGRNGEFTDPMGQESTVKSTTIAEVKALGIDEGSPIFHTMVKFMSRLDEFEERMFGAPIATSAHAAHVSKLAPVSGQPQNERLSYCYFDQYGKLIFRKRPELVSSAPETNRTNSGGVSTILPAVTYTPNSVCTPRTDDGTAAPHASLPCITVLFDSSKSSSIVPMPEASRDASQTDSQKFINRFWKSKEAELDMQATQDGDAHPLPCNKTLSMAETLKDK